RFSTLENVTALDVSALGNATVVLNCSEFSQLHTIRGSGSTVLQLNDSAVTFHGDGVHTTGIAKIDLAGASETLVIDGDPPTGLPAIHSADVTNVLEVDAALVDFTGIDFSGAGKIKSGMPSGTLYEIDDGSLISHILNPYGHDTIDLVS